LNKIYKIFHKICSQSGVSWDEIEKLPTAPNNIWDCGRHARLFYTALRTDFVEDFVSTNREYNYD
jgi:hypothetical protein